MRIHLPSLYLTLQAGRPVTIAGGLGTSIRVLEGRVWLTEEGVGDDNFVFAGSTYRVRTSGNVVLDCDTPSRLEILAPVSVHAASPFTQRLAGLLLRGLRAITRTGPGGAVKAPQVAP